MRAKSKRTLPKSDELVVVEIDPATHVLKSDMEKVDRHVITREEYEEIPELTREWFERADFKIGDKLIRRGRPPKKKKKVAISIRLSEDVVEAFKYCGPGWQTRIDEALAQWLEEHPADAIVPKAVKRKPAARKPAVKAASKRAAPRKRAAAKKVTAPAPSTRAGSKRSSPRSRRAP